MCDNSVCGYTNWETFTIAVEIDNDGGLLDSWRETALDCDNVAELAQQLQSAIEGQAEDLNIGGYLGTLLVGALESVDWSDLADTLWTSAKEQYPDEFAEKEEEYPGIDMDSVRRAIQNLRLGVREVNPKAFKNGEEEEHE